MISLEIKYLNIFEDDKIVQESLVYEKEKKKEKKHQTECRCCFFRKEQQMAYAYIQK